MKRSIFLLFAIVSVAGMIAISGCKKKETYTVTFNANGGTGTMQSQTFNEGEAQALTRNAFTYDGYTFAGWNTVQDGSGASYPDGYTLIATSDMTLYAQWTSNGTNPKPSGTLNGHDYVDLGLPSGLLWATCNVGATTPEGYGDFFAWGETTPKEIYNLSTYRFFNDDDDTFTKYYIRSHVNDGTAEVFTDNLTTLEASDDAATANWGAGWRMPTEDEMRELLRNCTMTWTTQNGVPGCLCSGSNGNTIFLPAAGLRGDNDHYEAGNIGIYWSSSLETVNWSDWDVWSFCFEEWSQCGMEYGGRDNGFSVRPVCRPAQN